MNLQRTFSWSYLPTHSMQICKVHTFKLAVFFDNTRVTICTYSIRSTSHAYRSCTPSRHIKNTQHEKNVPKFNQHIIELVKKQHIIEIYFYMISSYLEMQQFIFACFDDFEKCAIYLAYFSDVTISSVTATILNKIVTFALDVGFG